MKTFQVQYVGGWGFGNDQATKISLVKFNLNTILPALEEIFLGKTFPLYSGNQIDVLLAVYLFSVRHLF